MRPSPAAVSSLLVLIAVGLPLDAAPQQQPGETLRVRPGEVLPVEILPPQPPEPLVQPGPAPDLEILFTSEVRGFYQPCG